MAEHLDTASAIASLEKRMTDRFDAVDQRFADLIALMTTRFDAVDRRFGAVDQRFETVTHRFDAVDARMGRLEASLVDQRQELRSETTQLRTDLTTEVRQIRSTAGRQLWTIIGVLSSAVVAAVVKFLLTPGGP